MEDKEKREAAGRRPTVDVIIPVYKPDKKFSRLLKMLSLQTYPVGKIIVMNTEKAYWKDEGFQGIPGLEVHHLTKQEFDHGATRNRGAKYSRADIIVFMTDDAVPADRELIGNLAAAFSQRGPQGESVIMAYARQLPCDDCSLAEQYTRSFNYPEQSCIKTKADLGRLGIKTFFCSNVCAAYRKSVYDDMGGFPLHTIFNEDMLFAAKAVQAGYAVAYVPEARVVHSHNLSPMEQFRRNFDMGVSQADHPEVFAGVPSEGEGIRLVKQTAAHLLKTGRILQIPGLVVKSGFKYAGYRLGKAYRRLPKGMVLRLTMNKNYWRNGK